MANSIIPMSNKAKCAFQPWGTTLEAEKYHIGMLIINSSMPMTIWMPSVDTVSVRWIDNSGNIHYKSSTNNEVSFSLSNESGNDYTLTRDDEKLTITATANASMMLIYDSY